MKTITLDLPDKVASIFESLPNARKAGAALLAAIIAQSKSKNISRLFENIDERVIEDGISDKEINSLLDEIS